MAADSATTIRTVDLDHDQVLVLDNRPGARVQVLFGGIWLTEEGRAEDVFARRGEVVALRSGSRALLEGLGPTRVVVTERLRQRWTGALAGKARRGAAIVARLIRWSLRPWTAETARGTLATAGLIVGIAVPTLVLLGLTGTAIVIPPQA